tara:strand:+ start:816 stop:1151 length:336 start_codon:yes stop_codon:yes gene_type:complete
MKKKGKLETTGSFYQEVHSVSMDDLVDIWIELFHPFGVVLVLFDVGNYFKLLQDCGILCSLVNAYDNKILTVVLPGVEEAMQTMDNIKLAGFSPIMYLYDDGKKLLDNIEP